MKWVGRLLTDYHIQARQSLLCFPASTTHRRKGNPFSSCPHLTTLDCFLQFSSQPGIDTRGESGWAEQNWKTTPQRGKGKEKLSFLPLAHSCLLFTFYKKPIPLYAGLVRYIWSYRHPPTPVTSDLGLESSSPGYGGTNSTSISSPRYWRSLLAHTVKKNLSQVLFFRIHSSVQYFWHRTIPIDEQTPSTTLNISSRISLRISSRSKGCFAFIMLLHVSSRVGNSVLDTHLGKRGRKIVKSNHAKQN